MRNDLDKKLKRALGSPRQLDVHRFTNRVMDHLEEAKKNEESSLLRNAFQRYFVLPMRSQQFAVKASVITCVIGVIGLLIISVILLETDWNPAKQTEGMAFNAKQFDTTIAGIDLSLTYNDPKSISISSVLDILPEPLNNQK